MGSEYDVIFQSHAHGIPKGNLSYLLIAAHAIGPCKVRAWIPHRSVELRYPRCFARPDQTHSHRLLPKPTIVENAKTVLSKPNWCHRLAVDSRRQGLTPCASTVVGKTDRVVQIGVVLKIVASEVLLKRK